ncbi:MAG: putative methyltransferase [Candidatus Azotimanducaceae bacterium]|jgi:predicted methyltransferase
MKLILALLLGSLSFGTFAESDAAGTEAKIKSALADERRTAEETARDKNRKPLETLKFFGLKDDMRVLELLPGSGWYTKILAPTLEENGKLYISIGAEGAGKALSSTPGFSAIEVIPFDATNFSRKDGERKATVPELSFGVKDLDMVLTFRNMHNLTAEGRTNINKATFDALNSGGLYGVVDHTRRHMQSEDDENWRRIDPVQVIKEVEESGFEFVDYSPLHYRPDDELKYEVGRSSVTGNTDRFTLLFRKP